MADFNKSLALVRNHEGGYANVSGDRGGETYAGITRIYHPAWPGWAAIDAAKPLKHNAVVPAAEPLIAEFYEQKYWQQIQGDLIQEQRVAEFLFDWLVNSGRWAIIHAQREVGVKDDGNFGPKTLAAINTEGATLFERLKTRRINYVRNLSKYSDQRKFLKGWLSRIDSF